MKSINLVSIGAVITAVAMILSALPCYSEVPAYDLESEPVASVNGSLITMQMVDLELNQIRYQARLADRTVPGSQIDTIKKGIIEKLITNELLYQESHNWNISSSGIGAWDRLTKLKQNYSDETEFQNVLIELGLTVEDLRVKIDRGLAIQKLITMQIDWQIAVSDIETKAFYDEHRNLFRQAEQIRAAHILFKIDAEADETLRLLALERAERIREKIEAGENFHELARIHSDCPSREKGGDLGFFKKGDMERSFEAAAAALDKEEISPVIKTTQGYHLIKTLDRKEKRTISFSEAKEKITDYLKKIKTRKEVDLYVEKLKETARIQRF
jgi:peptidyl-prolyl cis-trans isomerase C